jgi:hypothetical protein
MDGIHDFLSRRRHTCGHTARFEILENRLCLSSISGCVWHDLNGNAVRETFVSGNEPDVVMVIDESGSTYAPFGRVGIAGSIEADENETSVSIGDYEAPYLNPVIIVSPVGSSGSSGDTIPNSRAFLLEPEPCLILT